MKRAFQFPLFRTTLLTGLLLSAVSCNTTPNERKEIANREIDKLDERADQLANKTKEEALEAREALARRKADEKLRKARGPVAGKQQQMEQELLGDYQSLSQVSADSLRDAYTHFLQQVRARKDVWTMEDWDYANEIYKRLNEREKVLHDDIILRHATKIRALQAEYLALENRADLKDYQRIKKEQEGQ
jgi:flagellar biosynthesis GTPase FlhF